MPAFEDLPYDVIFELSNFLDLDDVVHLSQTCRQLKAPLFMDDKLARKVIEAHHLYTDEALQALQGTTTYREALYAIYDRRYAFSNAKPFSAQIIGQGTSFLYRQGVLCLQRDSTVLVMNLRSAVPTIHLDIRQLLDDRGEHKPGDSYKMMNYRDEILAVHVTNNSQNGTDRTSEGGFLVPIRTSQGLYDRERVIRMVGPIRSSLRLFVRHTPEYMYWGSHDGQGGDGHRKWVINGCSIDWSKPDKERGTPAPFLIDDFHGNDVGSTVAFEIHDGYFYAVSNQGTYEVEEVDWTSFYHCVRFPVDNYDVEAIQKDERVYRRQHAEGAIHDSWTDLTLQHDERTNGIYIVESRREWIGASSKQARTFYTSRIQFPVPELWNSSSESTPSSNDKAPPLPLPDNDIMATLLGSSHNANYMPTPEQYSWTRHPEFSSTKSMPPNPRSFILARTKSRAYNLSCSTFMDLVEDEKCCPDRPMSLLPCLRLKIGSRRIAPLGFNPFGHEDRTAVAKCNIITDSLPSERVHYVDNTQYRYTPMKMWPPPPSTCPCAARLHHITNPVFRSSTELGSGKSITAICDERSVVYMVKPNDSYHYTGGALGTIVLIDFGRSPSNIPSNDDVRWSWTPGQDKRCMSGTCS